MRLQAFFVSVVLAATPVIASEKPAPVIINVTETANLRALADKAGYDGRAEVVYAFVVPKGAVIMGKKGGGTGIDTGVWPQSAKVALVIYGHVYGGGGHGGDGGDVPGPTEGGRGGDAINVQTPLAVTLLPGASIKAGGGGGAGASGGYNLGGSGGGGGFPNGDPGRPGSPTGGDGGFGTQFGEYGRPGTPGSGGFGGQKGNPGGRGGNAAMPGDSLLKVGGAAGNAIRANGHPIDLLRKGDIYGEIF